MNPKVTILFPSHLKEDCKRLPKPKKNYRMSSKSNRRKSIANFQITSFTADMKMIE